MLFFKEFSFQRSLRKLWNHSEDFWWFAVCFCIKVERSVFLACREITYRKFERIWKPLMDILKGTDGRINLKERGNSSTDTRRTEMRGGARGVFFHRFEDFRGLQTKFSL